MGPARKIERVAENCVYGVEDFMATKAESTTTTDHDEIRRWAEERHAEPACVRGTGGQGDIGMLRLDFPGYSGEQSLQHINWDDWFDKFDERNLAFLHQDTTAEGEKSNFNKLISRETAENAGESGRTASKTAAQSAEPKSSRSERASGSSTRAAKKSTGTKKSAAASHTKSASAKRTGAAKRTGTSAKRTGTSTSAKRSASSTSAKRSASSAKRAPAKTGGRTKSR
jgi:hypothetical protein